MSLFTPSSGGPRSYGRRAGLHISLPGETGSERFEEGSASGDLQARATASFNSLSADDQPEKTPDLETRATAPSPAPFSKAEPPLSASSSEAAQDIGSVDPSRSYTCCT